MPEDGESPSDLETLLLEEILYARQPPVHEGRRPPYGCFIFTDRDDEGGHPVHMRRVNLRDPSDYASARIMANGTNTFMLRALGGGAALVSVDRGDELSLMRAATDSRCHIVQRHPNGTVRVFGQERVLIYENDSWHTKPYAFTRWLQLAHVTAIETNFDVGCRILDFCLHVLASRHIGATIVWMLRDKTDTLLDRLSVAPGAPAARLSMVAADHAEPLAALLASTDGACLVENDGTVAGVGAVLQYGKEAETAVAARGGTRHTSATRFTFDEPRVVAFVVSADGPVTVFSDGVDVLRLSSDRDYAPALSVDAQHPSGVQQAAMTRVGTCATCSKRLVIETVAGTDGKTTRVRCPVCLSYLQPEQICLEFRTRVLKPWEVAEQAAVEWEGTPA